MPLAREVARESGVHLCGHGGNRARVLGALAGVGLRLAGQDGLFLWMPGTRTLPLRATYRQLRATVPIDTARAPDRTAPGPDDVVQLGDWVRPVLIEHHAVLLLQPRGAQGTWTVQPRSVVTLH